MFYYAKELSGERGAVPLMSRLALETISSDTQPPEQLGCKRCTGNGGRCRCLWPRQLVLLDTLTFSPCLGIQVNIVKYASRM